MKAKLITVVVLVIIVVLFAVKNATETAFWFFRPTPFNPNLSLLLLVTFIVGIVVGILVTTVGRKTEKETTERPD